MTCHRRLSWSQAWGLALALLGTPFVCVGQMNSIAPTDAPRDAMIRALGAMNPHPSIGDEARTFDRLVGSWDCDYTFYLDDGSVRHKSGEVLFGWVLDGLALQDIWITYPTDAQRDRTMGTSIRFFDTTLKQWRVLFVSPRSGYVVSMRRCSVLSSNYNGNACYKS